MVSPREQRQLRVCDIADAAMDFHAIARSGEKKSDVTELQIHTTTGDRYAVGVEAGAPLLGVWNVLKNLGKRNRSNPENG